jgi:hypothetical protein
MIRSIFAVFVLLAAGVAVAETTPVKSPAPAESRAQVKELPIDPQKLAGKINGSFYHPDQLSEVECSATVDWTAFFTSLNAKVPDERTRALEGMQLHYIAARNMKPKVTFGWVNGQPDTAGQLQDGLTQMVSGFYQIYWSMMASAPVHDVKEIKRVEPQADGTLKVYSSDPNEKVTINLDKSFAPTHWDFDSLAYKGTFDLSYLDNQNQVPGELRLLSNMHMIVKTGESTMNVQIGMDYQAVDGVMIPHHVTYDIVGAYTIVLELTGCKVTKSSEAGNSPAQ